MSEKKTKTACAATPMRPDRKKWQPQPFFSLSPATAIFSIIARFFPFVPIRGAFLPVSHVVPMCAKALDSLAVVISSAACVDGELRTQTRAQMTGRWKEHGVDVAAAKHSSSTRYRREANEYFSKILDFFRIEFRDWCRD